MKIVGIAWMQCERVFLLLNIDKNISHLSGKYVLYSIPMLPAMLLLEILKKFLSNQGMTSPPFYSLIPTVILNIIFNYFFIEKYWNYCFIMISIDLVLLEVLLRHVWHIGWDFLFYWVILCIKNYIPHAGLNGIIIA